jgi:hypothetical protein
MTTELKEKIIVNTAQAAVVAATVGAIAKITYDIISIVKTLTK